MLAQTSPLTYSHESGNNTGSGLEYDLAESFAQELGVGVKVVETSASDIRQALSSEKYHIAIGWFSPEHSSGMGISAPLFRTGDILVQHEASLPIEEIRQLEGKTVHVLAGSRQEATLRKLAEKTPGLTLRTVSDRDILQLLEDVGERKVDYLAIDDRFEDIANQYVPTLHATLRLSEKQPIVWLLGSHPNSELQARLQAFIERIDQDGTRARLEDRYFGHVRRLTQIDIVKFLAEIETRLPKLRRLFHAAESVSDIDWRLIAAVAYHESRWDPNATSQTNVRGIMMLTEETADRLKVTNRLDPKEAILAGARYISWLKEQVGLEVPEPDRTWLALAAYNIGPGNFANAQRLARQIKADARNWYEMKRVLPMLAQPKVFQAMKIGRARGGEAVILVENIRAYYDILLRNAGPYAPTPTAANGIKHLVAEVDQLQRSYVRSKPGVTRGKANTTLSGLNPNNAPRLSANSGSD